jgi:hypothetical protein
MQSNIKNNQSSEKSFGLVFSVFFLIIAIVFYKSNFICYFFVISSISIMSITFIKPNLLVKPNYIWFRFGLLLGKVISPVVMIILYTIIIIPFGMIACIFRRNPLEPKFDETFSTYWIDRKNKIGPFKNQF